MIWLAAGIAGLFLFMTLFWVIRRAQQIIEAQGDQIIESESLAIVGEMGSAVAHGLRNPLASIRSSAELSLESTSPSESKECAEDIIAQVDRLDVWVKQLLTYAKPAHAQLASVDINQVLRMGVENYSRELERNAISINWRLAENLPAIRGDAVLLAQLVSSLIANAIDAMGKQGALTITSRLGSDGMVAAEVRDNGSGISQKDVGMIFKPFYTTKTKGLGLGLPLVRRVIERFGGSVELDSTPGEGTQVRLLLPVWR
jgi:signal transduction histidine kinase